MNSDITKYFTKHTSLCNIKSEYVSKCEEDINNALAYAESNPAFIMDNDLSDYYKGLICFFGLGELRDNDNGMFYLKAAADAGNVDAMNMYAFANYHMSINEKEDPTSKKRYEYFSIKYFKQACDHEHDEALLNLGICYVEGKMIDADPDTGISLIKRAAESGNLNAGLYLEKLNADPYDTLRHNRENDKDTVLNSVSDKILDEILTLPSGQQSSIVGIFNDIYQFSDLNYSWIKPEGFSEWVCSKDDGATYLICESELTEIAQNIQDLAPSRDIRLDFIDRDRFVYNKNSR